MRPSEAVPPVFLDLNCIRHGYPEIGSQTFRVSWIVLSTARMVWVWATRSDPAERWTRLSPGQESRNLRKSAANESASW